MYRWRQWRRLSALLIALTFASAAAAVPASDDVASAATTAGARETLVLAATVDDRIIDEPIIVQRLGRSIWLRAEDARRLGLTMTAATDAMVALGSMPGVHAVIDDAHQTIAIETPAHAPAQLALGARAPPAALTDRSGWGGFINYDVTGYKDGQSSSVGGSLDATVFTPRGFGYAGAVATVVNGHGQLRRSDIGYTIDAPDRLLSATAGDYINAASSVSRPVRMAGLRIGTDFSLRPDLITFPLPTISATAAVPTAVDVIVNGDRQAAGDVRDGAFRVTDVPVQTGVNTISVEVRDALGRPTLQTVSTYTSRALLKPGLSAWSAEVGWVRTGYLTPDDRYRQLAASGTWRRGLTDRLTLEAHGEAVRSTASGGIGASLALGSLGLVDLAASASRDGVLRQTGSELAIGFERIARPVTFSAHYTLNSKNWTDVASRYGSPTRRYTAIMNVGFDLARFGTLSGGVIALGSGMTRYDFAGRRLVGGATRLSPSTLVNATYSVRITDRIGFIANAAVDTRHRGSSYVSAGALLILGRRASGFVGATAQDGHAGIAANVSQSPVEQGEWGFRAAAATGTIDRAGAAVGYLGHAGYAEAVVDDVAGHVSGQVSARGSVGFAAGRAFTADTMTGSFAVIDTDGQANVPVYEENRRIGESDAHGRLVATNLSAYEPVKFSIDPLDIDPALSIGRTESVIRVARRSGVTVNFDLSVDQSRSFVVVDDAGRPIAPGARLHLTGNDFPVGIGGMIYVPLTDHPASAAIRLADGGACVVKLPAAASDGAGRSWTNATLTCHRETMAALGSPTVLARADRSP